MSAIDYFELLNFESINQHDITELPLLSKFCTAELEEAVKDNDANV